jgi:hypothetical protein
VHTQQLAQPILQVATGAALAVSTEVTAPIEVVIEEAEAEESDFEE